MEFALIVYLVGTVFPLIKGIGITALVICSIVGTIVIIGGPFFFSSYYEREAAPFKKGILKFYKWAIPVAIICGLAPSKEVSYTMIAAYTAQSIGENDKVQNIAGQSLEVIEAFLEKTKKELEKDSSNVEK